MATYTLELAAEINLPNLSVYKTLVDGVQNGWRVIPNDGYVMYDTAANNMELDPDTEEEIPVIYYYTRLECPLNTNFDTFTWVAVLRSTVDENYIFGGGDEPEHEVM